MTIRRNCVNAQAERRGLALKRPQPTHGGASIRVWFDDGSEGEVQFGADDFRGVIFEPLADHKYFALVDEELGTIVWPNDADIAPETLHAWATRGRDHQPA